MFCKNCGIENEESNKFCLNCGQPLSVGKSEKVESEKVTGKKSPIWLWVGGAIAIVLVLILVVVLSGRQGNQPAISTNVDQPAITTNVDQLSLEFEYPHNGQTLDYAGTWLFKVKPIANVQHYLWGFFQNGNLVWENLRDGGTYSGNEYEIYIDHPAKSKLLPGDVSIQVSADLNGEWKEWISGSVTIYLK
jgi:hypothetical protein